MEYKELLQTLRDLTIYFTGENAFGTRQFNYWKQMLKVKANLGNKEKLSLWSRKGIKKQYNFWQQNKVLYFTFTGKTPWPYWSQLILYKTRRWTTEISPEKAHKYYWLNSLYLTGNVIPFPHLEFHRSFRKYQLSQIISTIHIYRNTEINHLKKYIRN